MPESYIRYRLEGASLTAAKIAETFVCEKARQIEWREHASAFVAAHPAQASLLGLDFATVQAGDCGGRLRAYVTFPALYHANDKNFYLDCPIAHDGTHFMPTDAIRLSAEEGKKSGKHFYAGMGEGIAPLLHIRPEGIASPNSATHLSENIDYGGRHLPIGKNSAVEEHVYFATPEILSAFKAFESDSAAFTVAAKALTDAVSGIIETLLPKMRQRQEKQQPIRPSLYFNKTEKCLHVSIDNAYLPDHPALDIKDSRHHSYGLRFKVRPNTASAAGRRLAKLFNAAAEKTTTLAHKLGIPEIAYPRFVSISGAFLLVTRLPIDRFTPAPNKDWVLRDKDDEDYKIKKPPRPF